VTQRTFTATTEEMPDGGHVGNLAPFACVEMVPRENISYETTHQVESGLANSSFRLLTLKVFNPMVTRGHLVHGIVYLNVKNAIKVNNIVLKVLGSVQKSIGRKNVKQTISIGNGFTKYAVSSIHSTICRSPDTYNATIDDFNGPDVLERLGVMTNPLPTSEYEKEFKGPIQLLPGTHAIPFAIRIALNMPPSLTFHRSHKLHRGKAQQKTVLVAEVDFQPEGSAPVSITVGMLPITIQSCENLPCLINGIFGPGDAHLIPIESTDTDVLILLEKKHYTLTDMVRIYVYASERNVVEHAFAELVKATRFTELGLYDADCLIDSIKSRGMELIKRTKKQKLDCNFPKTFTSTISETYPIGTLRKLNSSIPKIDDERLMPVEDRAAGTLIMLKIKHRHEPSINAGSIGISYHVRVHLKISGRNKIINWAIPITLNDQLSEDYRIS